jgi:tRNA pseudouridine38-40 synthase
MKRILGRIEFEGSAHCGWASQDPELEASEGHKTSVQSEIEKSFRVALRKSSSEIIFAKGCGRTDAGVSASEYFFHIDLSESDFPASIEKLRASLNGILPASVVVTHLGEVPTDFDALESVKSKTYTYRLLFRRAKATLESQTHWWFPVDATQLRWSEFEACVKKLQGTHDFKAFRAAHGSAVTTRRTIHKIQTVKENCSRGMGLRVLITFNGAGFLKHMVRNLVGFLYETLSGKKTLKDLEYLLGETTGSAPDRIEAGVCAPAFGLTLEKVEYQNEPSFLA